MENGVEHALDEAFWVIVSEGHPGLEAISVCVPRNVRTHIQFGTIISKPSSPLVEKLLVKYGQEPWRGGSMRHSDPLHNWGVDPFGYDLFEVYRGTVRHSWASHENAEQKETTRCLRRAERLLLEPSVRHAAADIDNLSADFLYVHEYTNSL